MGEVRSYESRIDTRRLYSQLNCAHRGHDKRLVLYFVILKADEFECLSGDGAFNSISDPSRLFAAKVRQTSFGLAHLVEP